MNDDSAMSPKKMCSFVYTVTLLQFIATVNCSIIRGRRGHDHMVVGFTTAVQSVPITTTVVSLNPVHGEV
jgi:hypothetical protein